MILGCAGCSAVWPDDQALQLGLCAHIALWQELAQAARSVDAGLVEQMILGLPIVGPISRSHRWDPFDQDQQVLSVEQLKSRAWEFRLRSFVISTNVKFQITPRRSGMPQWKMFTKV